MERLACILLLLILSVGNLRAAGCDLLCNGGFEQPLESGWEARTPQDDLRKVHIKPGGGRQGAALVLENLKPTFTRLRQGHERSINAPEGTRLEFSAWVRSQADASARTTLQIYCMNEKGGITVQPISRPLLGAFDWQELRVRCVVPANTAYVMAYLQTRDGVGPVYFDDVALVMKSTALKPLPPQEPVALLSDLEEEHPTLRQAETLYGTLWRHTPEELGAAASFKSALVLYQDEPPGDLWLALQKFASRGGGIFMDMRAFARCHGTQVVPIRIAPSGKLTQQAQMASGLRVTRMDVATAGFQKGDIIPRFSWQDRTLMVLPQGFKLDNMQVLAESEGGEAGLVKLVIGQGSVTACDLLSMREPTPHTVESYYAFTPVSGALGNPVRFGRYFRKKLAYAGVVDEMRALAAKYPALILKDEGVGCDGERMLTLNIGNKNGPMYFIYAVTHGSEWEPGYGLLALAEFLAAGRMVDAVDLKRYQVKIMPILNPSGYTARKRQNCNGVDLNRQGELFWERFKGRDSNEDGVYGPFDYDWKGTAPFSEPATRVFHRIVQDKRIFALLDFHGNTSASSNKFGIMPLEALPDNEDRCWEMMGLVNMRLRGRHLLRQRGEESASQYVLTNMRMNSGTPTILNSASAGRYGLLMEITCGYGNSYGTVVQTDITCEICRAFFMAFKQP